MWSRRELKTNAKAVLSRGYWTPFLACLLLSLLGANSGPRVSTQISGSGVNFNYDSGSHVLNQASDMFRELMNSSIGFFVFSIGFFVMIIALAISLLFKFMLVNPLRIGRV